MNTEREVIITVDDDMTNLIVAKNNLDDRYAVFTASSGEKFFQILEKVTPDLVLLDIEMPVMDGYEVIKRLKSDHKNTDIPVIFLTTKIDPDSEVKGLNLGAVDYITKPFSRELLLKRIELHLLLEKQKKELQKYNRNLKGEVYKKTQTIFELQNVILGTVAELVECRDNVTGGHIERTQFYLSQLVEFLIEHGVYSEELASLDMNLLVLSSQLHDVGKISIKDEILMKPGKLTTEEFEEMKKHTVFGVNIIDRIREKSPETTFLEYARIMAGTHHEKWNGTGYPNGLKGDAIPLMGRLMAVIDVYDALTNERPYKRAYSHDESIDIIRNGNGIQFDPMITNIFLMHEKEFRATVKNHPNLDAGYSDKQLRSTLQVVANIVDIRGGRKSNNTTNIHRYLGILLDALKQHDSFKNEVAGWDTELLLVSAQLHDAGKLGVADDILHKPGQLTADEYEHIKTHTDFGLKIVQQMKKNVDDDLLHHAEAMAGSHHEKWDGTGYPMGLKGRAIPLQGRLMAIIDAYDALTSDRPHKEKVDHREALEIIKKNSGTQFDPELVEVFISCEKAIAMVGNQ